MSEQTAKSLNVNFSHRITGYENDTLQSAYKLTMEEMATRATHVLRLIADQFARSEPCDSRLHDDVIYFSITTVINEIQDMENLSYAFLEANRIE